VIGDRLPEATFPVPISLTWRDVHSMCATAHPPTVPVLTYSAMLKHLASHFAFVKLPKNSRLGKCSVCIKFAQQRLRAKSPLEAAQFASARTQHLTLSSAERLSYKDRCHQAKSRPSVYMSLIIDYSNPLPLPTHSPVPKAWMHYGNRFTMVLGGLIDHSHGKHLFLHPQPFWPKDANLVISTLFHHIRARLLTNTTPNTRPSVLYLQADNCAAENKNVYMLAFLSLLVSLDVFQEVYLSFLLVGHTHEDIDQLFSTAQTKFHTSSIHTPAYVNST